MSGQWVYEAEPPVVPHKCVLPNIISKLFHPGSVWECACGLRYELMSNYKLQPQSCGKTVCCKQNGHKGSCSI